ncbi:MAG: coproporphyrinogen III oxidase, partial [Planctomycetaceae bacterium]
MVTETTNTTEVGSYFVSNYPPFSLWKPEWVPEALERFREPPRNPQQTLGLYVHIPFCRKRCRFCYFRVYTSQNANA